MKIYECMDCGEYSLDNTKECPFCGKTQWMEVDSSAMDDTDWDTAFDLCVSGESKFAAAQAWAETGTISGMMTLADVYMGGLGCKQDDSKAFEWMSKAAELKSPEAISYTGMMYVVGTATKKDVQKGLSMLWKASDLKDPSAPYFLGLLYKDGECVKQDLKKAARLFKLSAERGEPDGMFAYGMELMTRAKGENEIETALSWLWRAARKDLPEAQLALGTFFDGGISAFADENQANYWLRRAVLNECDGAASAYAEFCFNSDDDLEDEEIQEIFGLLYDALERGDCTAAKTLGDAYRDGIYVTQDFERAYKFYRQGQGSNIECSARAAHCYRYGEGVKKNAGLAFKIYSDIYSENENIPVDVILELADMYENGEGVSRNQDKSAELYSMAASIHNPCGMRQMGIFILEDHPFVKGTEQDAVNLLRAASDSGDLDAALYLVKYYIASGDRKTAEKFMDDALIWSVGTDSDDAVKTAKEFFPELLDEDEFDGGDKQGEPEF